MFASSTIGHERTNFFISAGRLFVWVPTRAVLVDWKLALLVDVLGNIDDPRVALQRDDFINTTSVPGS